MKIGPNSWQTNVNKGQGISICLNSLWDVRENLSIRQGQTYATHKDKNGFTWTKKRRSMLP